MTLPKKGKLNRHWRWMKRRNCVGEELRRTMGIAIRDRETGYRSGMGLRMEIGRSTTLLTT